MSGLRALVWPAVLALAACASAPAPRGPHPTATSSVADVRGDQRDVLLDAHDYLPGRDRPPRRFSAESFATLDEELRARTAQIRVRDTDGNEYVGSGVVLCQDEGRLYVLTARHVLNGKMPPGRHAIGTRPFEPERVTVRFPEEHAPRFRESAKRVIVGESSRLDVALLALPQAPSAWRAPVGRVGAARELAVGDEIRSYGYSTSADKAWYPEPGTVTEVGEVLGYRPNIDSGYSGGPVFDARGALVGINTYTLGDRLSEAVPIEQVQEEIAPWLGRACHAG